MITVFTEAGADLAAVYRGLQRQTWKEWQWVIAGEWPASVPWADDSRVVRDTGQWKTVGESFLCWLPAPFVLKPTTLERWAWFLHRHPHYLMVDGRVLHGTKEEMLSGRFETEKGESYETPFLSRGRLASFFSSPQAISNDALWTEVVKEEKGAMGWTIGEPASIHSMTLSGKALSPEAAANRSSYLQEEELVTPRRLTFQPIDLDIGWPISNSPAPSPKRVLMLLPSLQVNGANTFNLYVARTLAQTGYAVHVITLTGEIHLRTPLFEELTDEIFHLSLFLDPHDYAGFISSFIQSRGIGAIFTSETHLGKYLIPLLRSRAQSLSVLDYCHVLHEDERAGSHPRQTAALLSQFDLAAVSSTYLREWILQASASQEPERIEVCYTGVDAEFWYPELAEASKVRAGIPANRPVLLYACRLDTQKNPMLFAEVVTELMREDKIDFEVFVVGHGRFREPMHDFFQKNGVENRVRFTGFADLPLMRDIYHAADVFFLPSLWEGISLALYEAMAMGLPSVVTDVGGQRELLTPECGVLVSLGSDLKEACKKALLPLFTDADLRHRMGKAARRRITEGGFDLAQVGRRILELFERAETLRQKSPRPIWPIEAAMELIRQEIATEDAERKQSKLRGNMRLLTEQLQLQQKKLDKLAAKAQAGRA